MKGILLVLAVFIVSCASPEPLVVDGPAFQFATDRELGDLLK